MRLEQLRLRNFRCFGRTWTEIEFNSGITTFVGANGAGKTAVFLALARLFGIGRAQRSVVRRDFHVSADGTAQAELEIEARVAFPELDRDDAEPDGVPELFRHLTVEQEGGPLFCRIRLRASWSDDGTSEGAIEEDCRWINLAGDPDPQQWEQCPRVSPAERAAVQLVYVPASRDVARELTTVLRSRIWRAARWSKKLRTTLRDASGALQSQFQAEAPAAAIVDALSRRWEELHRADTEREPVLRLVETDVDAVLRRAELVFSPDERGGERALAELSDGQRALFHIALTAAALDVERAARREHAEHFDPERLARPHLTLLAIEEPENNLAPFFLARIVAQARALTSETDAQVLLSSHSASILGRIEPEEVRYFRLDEHARTASVRKLTLPAELSEAGKYVRLAVRAYPELYFARFVILGEGDSERIVIPRLAEAMGVPLDPSFVPVVPLGGRHVEHFWRLLEDLRIPYATLLDLDCGRTHGGGRIIRQILDKLQTLRRTIPQDLTFYPDRSEDQLERAFRDKGLRFILETQGIFLSAPLDLDFSMLRAFSEVYRSVVEAGRGPQRRQNGDEARRAVLGVGCDPKRYPERFDELFTWYRYLFLGHSKPEIHLAALAQLSDEELCTRAPAVLRRLVRHVAGKIGIEVDRAAAPA